MDKAQLRQLIKLKLKGLDQTEYLKICSELTHQVSKFLKPKSNQSLIVASVLPMKNEIAPDPKVLAELYPNFIWVYPVEVDGMMKFAETSGELGEGPWLSAPETIQIPDIILIPALAFDKKGQRLGRGRSYYDQYLSKLDRALRVGVAWSEQVVDQVPVEGHDQVVNEIITEQGHWSVSGQCFLEGEF